MSYDDLCRDAFCTLRCPDFSREASHVQILWQVVPAKAVVCMKVFLQHERIIFRTKIRRLVVESPSNGIQAIHDREVRVNQLSHANGIVFFCSKRHFSL